MPKLKKQKSNKISGITRLGALMEHIDEKVTLVAEGVSSLDTRMDRVERTLDHHTEMIGNLAVNIEFIKSSLKRKVDAEEFEALEKRVSSLESRFLKH